MGSSLVQSNSERGEISRSNNPCYVDSNKGEIDNEWEVLIDS